ncbi:MAG: thioredoxin family protein [Muribaculaceae bacterium]|nr:thioredoxin family protein [Muribaculaceae bacterium]
MKKSLLLSAAFIVAASGFAFQNARPLLKGNDMYSVGPTASPASSSSSSYTRASGAIDFSYAQGVENALSLNGTTGGKTRVFMSFQMTPEDIKAYAGSKVTGFTVYSPTGNSGTNSIASGRFFYTTTLRSEDYTQEFDFSKSGYAKNDISLDTPYTITGEEGLLVFGYSLIVPRSDNMYYVPIDGVPNDNPGTCLINTSNTDAFPSGEWMSPSSMYGALSMAIRLEGDNLPENQASIVEIDVPPYLPVSGKGTDVAFLVKNVAANALSSVEATVSVTGMPDMVQSFEFSPISFGNTTVLVFNGVKANQKAFVDFSMQLTKVNGEPYDGTMVRATVPAYEEGFLKKIVAEDATGTWCGWCPGGIEALEYLKKTYPDRAIAIGVHNEDDMAINEYQKFINEYVGGFPTVIYNRMISQTPTFPYTQVCDFIDQVAAYLDFPSYAEVSLEGLPGSDEETASVKASTRFAIGTSVPHYLSFVVVEDNVGPYVQQNYFPSQRVPMNGWETKGSAVKTMFNDVARYYNCYPGIANSLPSVVESDRVYEYSIDIPLSNVKGNDFRVIAMLSNAATGEIVNACEFSMSKDSASSAVEGIENSDSMPAEYYNLNGVRVAKPTEGIFIRRQGDKTEKVIVK